jgi:hypothetical protein
MKTSLQSCSQRRQNFYHSSAKVHVVYVIEDRRRFCLVW